MNKKLTYQGSVMTWECDSNGHMNVMYYINKFENAGRNYSLDIGVAPLMNKEIGFVVVQQTIKYIREVFEDDLLYIESSLVKVSTKAMTFKHEMYNRMTKEKVSEMNVVGVMFDKVNRKAIAIPEEVKNEMSKLLS